MKKAQYVFALFIVIGVLSGCDSTVNENRTPTSTPPQVNVTCNEFSFHLEPVLGSGVECETVPENSNSDIPAYYLFVYPAHTELTILDYPLTRTQFPPRVWVYPVDRFGELLPDFLPDRVSDLQRTISDGAWEGGVLPFLPIILERQVFVVHETGASFNGGRGVRFITAYIEGAHPVSNRNLIYTFQGLTDDGRYWVSVTLPISSPVLPADDYTPPEGYSMDDLIKDYDTYLNELQSVLDAQAPDTFSPAIQDLDNLVQSITFQP